MRVKSPMIPMIRKDLSAMTAIPCCFDMKQDVSTNLNRRFLEVHLDKRVPISIFCAAMVGSQKSRGGL